MNTQHPQKILIIDDEQHLCDGYRRIVTQAGYEAISATSLTEGWQFATEFRPDVILLDVALTDGNGLDLCRKIKTDAQFAGTLVLLLSGKQISSDEQADGLEAGADCYLLKPIAPRELLARVKALLRLKETETRLQNTLEELRQTSRLNQLLLDSLPHPAMLLNRERIVVAANRIAREMGATVGGFCWQDFGKCEFISAETRALLKSEPDAPAIKTACCSFCLLNDSLEAQTPINLPEVEAFGRLWDTWWIPVERGLFLRYAIDVSEMRRVERAQEQEWDSLEKFSSASRSPVTEEILQLKPLHQAAPVVYEELLGLYNDILTSAVDEQLYKVNHNVAGRLQHLAERLGLLRAAPRDVVHLHVSVMKTKMAELSKASAQAYLEAGRLTLLELMGNLVSFYRLRISPRMGNRLTMQSGEKAS